MLENNLEFTRTSLVEAQIVSRESDIWREFNNNFWSIMNQITTEMKLGKFGTSSELLSQMSDPDKLQQQVRTDRHRNSNIIVGQITGYMSDKELKYGAITTYERTWKKTNSDSSDVRKRQQYLARVGIEPIILDNALIQNKKYT
ncbi:11328_t:CDS:2 [Entrophospora sp. SA101]|nr:11328_t:CDS:2 [Entrophospora sp. SA101]